MEDKERLSILLAEYTTLKADVLAARTTMTQVISFGVPLFFGLLGLASGGANWQRCASGAAALAVFITIVLVLYVSDSWTRKITKRLRELEKAINDLADGRPLLQWETDYGYGSIFWPKGNKPPPQSK